MEYRDLYDDNKCVTGQIVAKGEPIPKGKYILTVMIFIVNDKAEVLLQKRSLSKGGLWATTGGHAKTGEDSIQGICSEAKEEIGVELDKSKLKLIHVFKNNYTFVDVYFYKENFIVKDLKLQEEEVQEVKWFTLEEIQNLFETGQFFLPHQEPYEVFLDYLKNNSAG